MRNPRRSVRLTLEPCEDRTVPAVYAVTMLSPTAGEPGDTAAIHSGELRLIPPHLNGTDVIEPANPVDAIRGTLTGKISVTLGGQSASYPFHHGTAGTSKSDHLPYLVRVSGTNGRVSLEDMAGLPNSDWDYDDRSWRVTVRVLNASASGGSGGGGGTLSEFPQLIATSESMWYPAMAEGPDRLRLRQTINWVSASEYRWDLEFANTSTDSGYPISFFNLGAQKMELALYNLDDILRFETPPYWAASKISLSEYTFGPAVRWETPSDFIMPGQSRTFTFYTPPRPLSWYPGLASTPIQPDDSSANAEGPGLMPGKPPRVIIADAAGNEVPDDPGLKVAKWHNAFEMTADGKSVKVIEPDGNGHDFIDWDNDRFNVWVEDTDKYNAGTATVDVDLHTGNVAGFEIYNDPATIPSPTLRLVRHKTIVGWYWSDSQMMVSNEVDDKYSAAYLGVDESGPGAALNKKEGHEFPVTDRTHRVALGGTVRAEYTYLPGAVAKDDAPVRVKKVVKLNVNILRIAAGGAAVATDASVNADIWRMREIYAQVGISIPPVTIQSPNPPVGVNLADGSLDEYTDSDADGKLILTVEESKLLGDASLRTPTVPGIKDDIEVYYVNRLSEDSSGESFPEKWVSDSKYADSVIMSERDKVYIVLAHEAAHVLENRSPMAADGKTPLDSHYPYGVLGVQPQSPLDKVNLMVEGERSVSAGTVLDSRRLTTDQETQMYTGRPNLVSDP